MKVERLSSLIIIASLLAASTLVGRPLASVQAEPVAQTNLVVNGGLDGFDGSGMATSWFPWWQETPNPGTGSLDYALKPEWAPETNLTFVHGGSGAQHIGRRWDPWYGGIRQTISVPPGATVRITAYGRVFASTPDWPSPSNPEVQSRMQIGADPNGGIEWFASAVRWSGQANPHDTWVQFTFDVTAGASGKVTLFLANNYRGDSRYHLDAWWDDVSAVVVDTGNPPPATQPSGGGGSSGGGSGAGVVPTVFVTPTPGPDGNIIYIVQEGDTLWRIASITGKTVDEIKALNGLTGDIISIGQRLIIGQGQPSIPPTNTPDPNAATPVVTVPPTTDPNAAPTTALSPTPAQVAVANGKICVLIWNDTNGNTVRDANESLLADGQLSVVDLASGAPVGAYMTDGTTEHEPHCFELPSGQYTVSATPPSGYNPTRAGSATLEIKAGDTSFMEFGAQPGGSSQATSGSVDNSRRFQTALFGALGVMLLLLAAGVAGFFFMRRR